MTEENKEFNISQEIEKARDCFKSAEILAANQQLPDAVSRLYYFAYHNLKALLLSRGQEAKTHSGMLTLLNFHFIKPGILQTNVSHHFARLMKYREEADYSPIYIFTEADYKDFKKEAMEMADIIETYLRSKGLFK